MLTAVFALLGLGLVCGAALGIASKVFYVWEDPRISRVEGHLAGANCGGCGFAGCSAAAVAVVNGKAGPGVCVISGPETAANVAGVMGMDPGTAEPLTSKNDCEGGFRADDRFVYDGVNTCAGMDAILGGHRECRVGCLGLGDCIRACQFDSLEMGPDGYPVVIEHKCVGCGACERVCPKNIIKVRTMSQRLLRFNAEDDAIAPCVQTCPAQINITRYIKQIRQGDYEGAIHTLRERNPLILACGRVCPHPCEDYCRRGLNDESVSINQLKRFVADYEMRMGKRLPIARAPDTGRKVAVIGGGPAGISGAYFLRRLGHDVTLYEAMPRLGGIVRYGIPEYRMPDKTLDWEIQGILDLGIKAHTDVRFGRDITMADLAEQGFDAMLFAVGAWNDYNLRIENEDADGCHQGIKFLSSVVSGNPPSIGRRAGVVGGGNSAIDCVRTLVRLGAEEVYIVYRRTRKEMPANEVEIVAAEHEGVKFFFLAAPTRVITDDKGHITHLEYLKMELGEPDASGRRRPVPIEGSETLLPLDMLITAIGQSPDISFIDKTRELKELAITRWNTIDADPLTLQSNLPKVFTAGDSATGPALVVDAIGGGRRAARSIHQYLTGDEILPEPRSLYKRHIPESLFEILDGVVQKKRTPMPELPVKDRIDSMIEVDQVITEAEARYEAGRCLNCCRLCYDPDKEAA